MVNWVTGKYRCQHYILLPLLEEIQTLIQQFNGFYIDHIYREFNEEADGLSKTGLQQAVGTWRITEQQLDQIRESDIPAYG